MTRPAGRWLRLTGRWLALLCLGGCAARGSGGMGTAVEFRAPSVPDEELGALLEGVEKVGVLSATNIEPLQDLDIEKVMGRLTDATAGGLRNLSGRTVLGQDEIRWHFREVNLDSAAVFSDSLQSAMVTELELDALVFVTLRSLDARMTPMTPSPYGMVASPRVNIIVDLQLLLVNLATGESWSHEGRHSSWQQAQLDLLGGGRDRTERQMLAALASSLRGFLARVAPPPSRQTRHFDVSGD